MSKTILITGASSGMGAELAQQYASHALTLILTGRDASRLENVAQNCRDAGAAVITKTIDVSHHAELQNWMVAIDESHPLDMVIANAGMINTIKRKQPIEAFTDIDHLFQTNVLGAIATVNPILERMSTRQHGQAVIISSLSAYRGIPTFPAYSASKAALKSYYEAMRGLLARRNVFITVACPGFIATPMTANFKKGLFPMLTAEQAASTIKTAIEKKKAQITFPFYLTLLLSTLHLLPKRLADKLLLLMFGL